MQIQLLKLAVLAIALAAAASAALSQSDYSAPETTPGEDGWMLYQNARLIDEATARDLRPEPESAESTVVAFLASQLRGDRAWRQTRASDLGRRERGAFDEWREWELIEAQLVARKDRTESLAYIRVRFEIEIDGDRDGGEDDFELVREGDVWRIKAPPR